MTLDWWTLGLQTVNVIVLVWLLGRFFWRPVADMIAQRRVAAQQMLTEAQAKRDEAQAALAAIQATRAGFAQEREAILAAAGDDAERSRAARLQQATRDAEALQAAARAEVAKHTEAAERAWAGQASHLAIAIAERLAARLDGAAVRAAFLDWLLTEIRALPEAQRLSATDDGVVLEAMSATPLDPAEQARYRALIGEAFGASPQIDFKADPALIAGLELRGPHLVVANSWRADLDRILADLTAPGVEQPVPRFLDLHDHRP